MSPPAVVVVALGGGHGTAVTLRAARRYAGTLTAVVSVADDGGSSGRLREILNVVALGDLRKCLVALARRATPPLAPGLRAPLRRRASWRGMPWAISYWPAWSRPRATWSSGVRAAAELLGAAGDVLPATVERVVLKAESDGGQVAGQVAVSRAGNIQTVSLVPGDAGPPPLAVERILAADQIVIGPGSLFTSVLAAAAVEGDRRRRGPLLRPARVRVQPAPAAPRDGRIRCCGPLGRSEQA